jgi:lactate 2-monooxygenase
MALGARICFIGRTHVYGLVLGEQAGVSHVLKSLLGDLELNLHLSGISSATLEHLNRDVLIKESDMFS